MAEERTIFFLHNGHQAARGEAFVFDDLPFEGVSFNELNSFHGIKGLKDDVYQNGQNKCTCATGGPFLSLVNGALVCFPAFLQGRI